MHVLSSFALSVCGHWDSSDSGGLMSNQILTDRAMLESVSFMLLLNPLTVWDVEPNVTHQTS